MSEQKKGRNPYSDTGLMIAVSIFIVMIVKCLLFDVTAISIGWMALCVVYFVISYIYDSENKITRHSTTAFILLSVVLFGSIILLDQNVKPKMHAFEGAKKDTLPEEEFMMKKDPTVPVEIQHETDDTDTLSAKQDSIIDTEQKESESIDDIESQDQTTEDETETQNTY